MRRTLLSCALLAVAVAAVSASVSACSGKSGRATTIAVVTLENTIEPDIKERVQPDLDGYLK